MKGLKNYCAINFRKFLGFLLQMAKKAKSFLNFFCQQVREKVPVDKCMFQVNNKAIGTKSKNAF